MGWLAGQFLPRGAERFELVFGFAAAFTSLVWAETLLSVEYLLRLPVTRTEIFLFRSVEVSLYCDFLAPLMALSLRNHW